jgi:hypothetical protein
MPAQPTPPSHQQKPPAEQSGRQPPPPAGADAAKQGPAAGYSPGEGVTEEQARRSVQD